MLFGDARDATHFLLELANRHWLATATLLQSRVFPRNMDRDVYTHARTQL